MKIFSYTTASIEETPAKRKWIEDMGLTVFKEHHIQDFNHVIILFIVPDSETEIMLKLKYGMHTFVDRSA